MSARSPVSRLTAASLKHRGPFIIAAVALAAAGAWLASGLQIRSSFEELLPPDLPSVRHVKELARRVGGDGTVLVNVEALDGDQGLSRAEAMAERLAGEYRALGPGVIRSVESNLRPVERWYADHWPMFLSIADLQKARDELVKAIGKAKARANPMMNLLGDEEEGDETPITISDPLLDPAKPSPRAQVEQRFARYPDGFMVAPDHRSVTIVVRPTGTSLGVDETRKLLARMRSVVDAHRGELDADHLRVGFAGTFPILLSEYEAIVGDVFSTFAIVLALVLASIVVFFRELRPVLALGAAILVAVAVTFGLTRLVIGYLNTQTAFLGSIVAGNGINYGLVYLARVGQLRRRGVALGTACDEGARAAARATLLASIATSVSFGTLIVASNRGFRHFGFIGGVGMLLCWAATFALVPALLSLFERIRPASYRPQAPESGDRPHRLLEHLFARPRALLALFAVLGAASLVLFLWRLPSAMERNLDNLTNEVRGNAELKRDNDRANAALGQSITGVVALLPSREAAEGYCAAIEDRTHQRPRLQQLIQGCETISAVVPSQQPEKLAILHEIRDRLTSTLIARLPAAQARRVREIRADLAAQGALTIAEAPPVLVDRFREHDGTVGRLAFVRAKPDAKLELGPNLADFAAGVRGVPVDGVEYDAAGEQVVIADLLADIEREGPRTTLFSFVAVCALVLLFIRSWRRSALLLLSLSVGVALMAGVAALLDLKINFFNFIVYPITFGIAVDYGANVIARMHVRRTVLPALAEVGPAVVLCSWTTIVGYGSLLLSINRALRSFGWYAMLGEVTTLVSALVMLPAFDLVFPPRGHRERPQHEPAEAGDALPDAPRLERQETPHVE